MAGKRYVYVWADGVHFNVRLEQDRQCILVLIGATADGKKELIAVADGYRKPTLSESAADSSPNPAWGGDFAPLRWVWADRQPRM